MNIVLRKLKSAYRRLKKRCEVAFFFNRFYVYEKKIYDYHNIYYSQQGEDIILSKLFWGKDKGFYLDVGAFHPQRFSNTYYFYLQGWKGINIDAKPGSMKLFNKIRPNDINLEIPISDKQETLTYYEFNEPALNGFSEEISKERDGLRNYQIIAKKDLKTYTLSEVLDKYLPEGQAIDFMNVDVEGLDEKVLKSNNWKKYRPKIVLVEDLQASTLLSSGKINESTIVEFMEKIGYVLHITLGNTLIFASRG